MEIQLTKSFERDYRDLPVSIQKRLDKQLAYLLENSRRFSLGIKKMEGHSSVWEGRISRQWRFTFQISGNRYIMRRAGTHAILRTPY
ncbi:MAG: hypothetical protein HYT98_01645 [Candidatus Sungbacteria bacterium]|nr:hypothetical protein [Candidatus Sungbacteria bacterium]